jgi:serine/threonine protein phosphatase 1
MLSRLFTRRRSEPIQAQLPEGRRIYAVGDIHGRLDLLDDLLAQITDDDAARGPARTGIVFLGDLIDRGPDSAGVVERVRALCADRPDTRCLAGNHEEIFLEAYDGDTDLMRLLLRVGGEETLLSYGLTLAEIDAATTAELSLLMARRVPADHVAFLRALDDYVVEGDYLFVHAGIRPGIAIEQQQTRDLRWIREPFLNHAGNHGMMVVHGHTITDAIETRDNRIGIDTGAYRTGQLTALGIEGGVRWVLETVPQNRTSSS